MQDLEFQRKQAMLNFRQHKDDLLPSSALVNNIQKNDLKSIIT